MPVNKTKQEFEKFLQKIKAFEHSRFETRAFVYLDIVSWLESKVKGEKMERIILSKFELDNPVRPIAHKKNELSLQKE